MGFFPGTQERVPNSRGKRAISVRGTEVLLYLDPFYQIRDTDQIPLRYLNDNIWSCKAERTDLNLI